MSKQYLNKLYILCLILLALPNILSAQSNKELETCTQKGNAKELSIFFNEKIELLLPERSGVFSKAQATMILDDFFISNPPTSFKIIHQGKKENTSFAIGQYNSGNNQFRLYFLLKKNDDTTNIQQLRIEEDDNK